MEIGVVIAIGVVAGWLVNALADGVPVRASIGESLVSPYHALRCAFGLADEGTCSRMHASRTVASFLAAVALGILSYERFGFSVEAGVVALYAMYLQVVTIIDVEHRKVLNRMLIAALPVVAFVLIFTDLLSLRSSLLGGLLGFGVFLTLALIRPGGMGMGDVKLAALIGLSTGVAGVTIAMFVGILTGGFASAAILMYKRFDRKATMAYAPYLALGAWIALYYGEDIMRYYLG